VAAVLVVLGEYRTAFALLAVPAAVMLALLAVARLTYPKPEELDDTPPDVHATGLPRMFWLYLAGAVFVAVGFADFPFMAYHLERQSTVPPTLIPVLYAVAMALSGAGSLAFGRLFDRFGLVVLVPLTVVSALFAPLVFLGGLRAAVAGIALWGVGRASTSRSSRPPSRSWCRSSDARPRTASSPRATGTFWFVGSVAIGLLNAVSVTATVAFCLVAELSAIPVFVAVTRRLRTR
jgi:predicted MFS family arabinose efflux permease